MGYTGALIAVDTGSCHDRLEDLDLPPRLIDKSKLKRQTKCTLEVWRWQCACM